MSAARAVCAARARRHGAHGHGQSRIQAKAREAAEAVEDLVSERDLGLAEACELTQACMRRCQDPGRVQTSHGAGLCAFTQRAPQQLGQPSGRRFREPVYALCAQHCRGYHYW